MSKFLRMIVVKFTDALIATIIFIFPRILKCIKYILVGLFSRVKKSIPLKSGNAVQKVRSTFKFSKKVTIGLIIPLVILATIHIPTLHNIIYENKCLKSIDNSSQEYVSDTFMRAGSAYAISRGINAVVSTLQESTVDVAAAGIGGTIAIGQMLDPLNDITERFSSVMVISMVSAGVMKVMIEIGPYISIYWLLSISMFLFIICFFAYQEKLSYLAKVILLIAIFVRVAIPAISYMNNVMYQKFLSDKYNNSIGQLVADKTALKADQEELINMQNIVTSESNYESNYWWNDIKEKVTFVCAAAKKIPQKLKEIFNHIKEMSSNIINKLIDLCLIFILNTIIFPIAFLWIGLLILKKITNIDYHSRLDSKIREQFRPLRKAAGNKMNESVK